MPVWYWVYEPLKHRERHCVAFSESPGSYAAKAQDDRTDDVMLNLFQHLYNRSRNKFGMTDI